MIALLSEWWTCRVLLGECPARRRSSRSPVGNPLRSTGFPSPFVALLPAALLLKKHLPNHRHSTVLGGGKRIHARANLNGCRLLLMPHAMYSHRRFQSPFSFNDSSAQSRGDDYGCSRVRRDSHSEMKSLAIDLPVGGDLSVERLIGRGGEGQPSSGLWLEDDMPIPRRARRNARDDLIEPVADSPIGIVVQGVMRVSFLINALPGLPDRRCPFFDCIQPGWRRVLHEQGIGLLKMVVVPQHWTEIRCREKASSQMPIRTLYQFHQTLYSRGTKVLWQKIKGQCPHIGGLSIRPQAAIIFHKLCNIGFFNPLMQCAVFPRIVLIAEDLGCLSQQASRNGKKGGCDMRRA